MENNSIEMPQKISRYIELLKDSPTENVFNPWWQKDSEHDDYSNSAEIRRNHLKHYLQQRIHSTRYLLIGEALGYQGGHFSGIAMTSERMLLGHFDNIKPEHIFTHLQPSRTSLATLKPKGFTEPTASIVWTHLLNLGVDSYTFTIWNAFPWHPYKPDKGLLSNRTPTDHEFAIAHNSLKAIIEILAPKKIVAIGEKASKQLAQFDLEHSKVRHPANGGATKFKGQFSLLL